MPPAARRTPCKTAAMHPIPNELPATDPSPIDDRPGPDADTSPAPGQRSEHQPRLRSGTAARLAGLPVTTLRVWERRYSVVSAARSPTGQRLYSNHDVARLRLLRQLSHAGHAIGTIASLDLEPLQHLAGAFPSDESISAIAAPARATAIAVGRSAAHVLESIGGCDVVGIFEDLDEAETLTAMASGSGGTNTDIDLLLLRLPSLQPAAVSRVDALVATVKPRSAIVLYAFGAEPTIDALQARGVTVRREPVGYREMARLVDRVRSHRETPGLGPGEVVPRRFSDEALAGAVAAAPTIQCECVRHLAEIVMQLASFERYSNECSAASDTDAALHRRLSVMTGAARAQFEQALLQVSLHNSQVPSAQTLTTRSPRHGAEVDLDADVSAA